MVVNGVKVIFLETTNKKEIKTIGKFVKDLCEQLDDKIAIVYYNKGNLGCEVYNLTDNEDKDFMNMLVKSLSKDFDIMGWT